MGKNTLIGVNNLACKVRKIYVGVMGYGVDSNAAVIFEDGKVSTISSQPNKCVHYLNTPNVNTRER